MTAPLQDVLDRHVAEGTAPGILAVTGRPGEALEYTVAGDIARDAIFRIQSMTKPVTAVATLRLVQDGRLALDDPVDHWHP
jgi:CubicO group peptidase (beta-lactamase class C family)